MNATLFHFSFAVDDIDQARKFYGEMLQCPLPDDFKLKR
jgi:extradiol dioxygenase family protein